MLPKFQKNGCLPGGLHKASLSEIKERFGSTSQERKELFRGLRSLIGLLQKHDKYIKKFLLNGSFVTAKEAPVDFDCILIVKEEFDFDSKEAKQLQFAHELFNAHLFTFSEKDMVRCRRLIDFFGLDRERQSKGLVEVLL